MLVNMTGKLTVKTLMTVDELKRPSRDDERGISHLWVRRLFHIATALGTPVQYFFAADETIETRHAEAGDEG